jgi:hypothetical protein
VVFSNLVDPTLEMAYFVFPEFNNQLFKDHDHTIFGILSIGEVFETYTINKIHISLIQVGQYVQVPG